MSFRSHLEYTEISYWAWRTRCHPIVQVGPNSLIVHNVQRTESPLVNTGTVSPDEAYFR